jgi:hypothetical protein
MRRHAKPGSLAGHRPFIRTLLARRPGALAAVRWMAGAPTPRRDGLPGEGPRVAAPAVTLNGVRTALVARTIGGLPSHIPSAAARPSGEKEGC